MVLKFSLSPFFYLLLYYDDLFCKPWLYYFLCRSLAVLKDTTNRKTQKRSLIYIDVSSSFLYFFILLLKMHEITYNTNISIIKEDIQSICVMCLTFLCVYILLYFYCDFRQKKSIFKDPFCFVFQFCVLFFPPLPNNLLFSILSLSECRVF